MSIAGQQSCLRDEIVKMLYIIRHGKTEWNNRKKLQGRTDIPLNEEGRTMARKAAKEYAHIHFDICYCSPLIRAKETAQILLENRDVPIIVDKRLSEMCFGVSEGSEGYDRDESNPVNVLFKSPEKYIVPVENGESLADLYGRTGQFLKEVVDPLLKEGKDVLIVGHGAANSAIICQKTGVEIKDFWSVGIENCKLKIIE